MFADDLQLLREAVADHGALPTPIVEAGGIESPTIADYNITVRWMLKAQTQDDIREAQLARYRNTHRPLSFLGDYLCEDPSAGGAAIEDLPRKYGESGIGTVIALSTLEHVERPWEAVASIWEALKPDGLAIVSVPFMFPEHYGPKDYWRFTPDALRVLFGDEASWEILYCDWRLKIPADAGVLDIRTGRPQAIESCALIARAR